jgi:hypothetical protein
MRTTKTKLALLIAAMPRITLFAADVPASAISTFESISLYYNRPAASECKVSYRVEGAAAWRPDIRWSTTSASGNTGDR